MLPPKTKASRERVGRKRNSFEGSKLFGVGRDSASAAGGREKRGGERDSLEKSRLSTEGMERCCKTRTHDHEHAGPDPTTYD